MVQALILGCLLGAVLLIENATGHYMTAAQAAAGVNLVGIAAGFVVALSADRWRNGNGGDTGGRQGGQKKNH